MDKDKITLANQVIEKLQEVEDPELLVDIVNLGLIYGVDIDNDVCTITMTLTTMGCPLNDYLEKQIKNAVLKVPGINKVDIKLVWYPVWSTSRLSDSAKETLGIKDESSKVNIEKKIINLHTPIKTFADQYDDFVEDMYDIGFTRIKQPGMLNTVGRVMNLKLGARAMNLDLEKVKKQLEKKGYQVED